MGALVSSPRFVGIRLGTRSHFALVETGGSYELWHWVPPSREYDIVLRVPVATATLLGTDGISLIGSNGEYRVESNGGPMTWNDVPLERLETSVWSIYTATNSRYQHLVGAPVRK